MSCYSYTQKDLTKKHNVIYLEQFLRVPDEECYVIIQLLYVPLKITCHHLEHKQKIIIKEVSRKLKDILLKSLNA